MKVRSGCPADSAAEIPEGAGIASDPDEEEDEEEA